MLRWYQPNGPFITRAAALYPKKTNLILAIQWVFYAWWHKIIRQTPKSIPAPDDKAQQAKQQDEIVDEQLQTMQQHFVVPKVQCPMRKEHAKRLWNVWIPTDLVQHLGDQK